MQIPTVEVSYAALSVVDAGRVFRWKGRLFRAIPAESVPAVRALFESGLVAELTSRGLLVRSEITDYELEGFALVIEHELVPTVTYPREWSFSMVRAAATLILDLNEVARRFGYQTKDCNGYNVLFRGAAAVFVDLGSLIPTPTAGRALYSHNEFLAGYVYPLQLWRLGGQYLGAQTLPRTIGSLCRPEAYLLIRWPILRWFSVRTIRRLAQDWNGLKTIRYRNLALHARRIPRSLFPAMLAIQRWDPFALLASIPALRRRLKRLRPREEVTAWSQYHDRIVRDSAEGRTPRFERIVQTVSSLGVSSVFEIGGNQGLVSRLIKASNAALRVTCTDADAAAIDKAYGLAADRGEAIDWAVLNPFSPESSPVETASAERFKSEAVLALALTHHLTLTNELRIDYVLGVIEAYSSRYVLVEYMPLGLADGQHDPPPTPAWYTEEWFAAAFRRRFRLLERTQLESNRILYVGEIVPQHLAAAD